MDTDNKFVRKSGTYKVLCNVVLRPPFRSSNTRRIFPTPRISVEVLFARFNCVAASFSDSSLTQLVDTWDVAPLSKHHRRVETNVFPPQLNIFSALFSCHGNRWFRSPAFGSFMSYHFASMALEFESSSGVLRLLSPVITHGVKYVFT